MGMAPGADAAIGNDAAGSIEAGGPVTATVRQVTDPSASGYVGPGAQVVLAGVVAMSPKFLTSKSSSGTCTWGLFLSAPGLSVTAPFTGILATSVGNPAVADGGAPACPVPQLGQPAGDAFPDDVAPGDVLDVAGETAFTFPAPCGLRGAATTLLENVTRATRGSAKATPPAPAPLAGSDVAFLASQDASWLGQWANVRVDFQNVNVSVAPVAGSLTDANGLMILSDGLEISDSVYDQPALASEDACHAGPVYPTTSPTFTSLTGFLYLDLCNWTLAPSDKCQDLDPPSADCAAVDDAGSDASAAAVCMH
jgi:hypothetical protein